MKIVVNELRRARQQAGLTQEQLAEKVGVSQSWVAFVETERRTPGRDFVANCDAALDTDGLLGRLFDHVLSQARTPAWFRRWLDVERQASAIRTYQPLLVPGLLQTEDYARALLADEARVATRMERQAVLDDLSSYVAVVDENVLTRPVGSPSIMAEQIARLVEDSRAVVHVVPTAVGYHTGLNGAFTLGMVDGAELAVTDDRLRGQVIERPEEVAVLREAWEGVRSEALPRRQSVATLTEARDRWKASAGTSPPAATAPAETVSK